jgi:hypothetical protein
MEITATPEQIQELWTAARVASDREANDYGEGAYDMIQALTGGSEIGQVLETLNESS